MTRRVYTINPVPIVVGGEVRCVDSLDAKELESLYRQLLSVVGGALKAARSQLARMADAGLAERLRVLNDTIVLSIKRAFLAPLLPPKPKGAPAQGTAVRMDPSDLLYVWAILRAYAEDELVRETVGKPLVQIDYEKFEELFRRYEPVRVVAQLGPSDPEKARERLELLLRLPADTRPGNNASKLVPHLLATSALASAMYLARVGDRSKLELEVLRLAAILHDLGKPEAWIEGLHKGAWVSHAAKSREVAKRMKLNELLGEGGDEVLEAVAELIEHHHDPSSLGQRKVKVRGEDVRLGLLAEILNRADRVASGIDRLGPLLAGRLSEASGGRVSKRDMERLLTESGPWVWKEWEKLGDLVDRLNAEACRSLSICEHEGAKDLLAKLVKATGEGPEDVALLLADVRGVQRFIGRESIRAVIAASMLVDVVTQYAVPRAIMEVYEVPPEAVIYAGGGFVVAMVPRYPDAEERAGKVGESARKTAFGSGDRGPSVTVALSPLYSSWPASLLRASAKLMVEKLRAADPEALLTGYEQACAFCGARPASARWRGEPVCDECEDLLRFGERVYVKYRLKLLEMAGYKGAAELLGRLERLMDRLMEWFSGEEGWEERSRDVAVVKADGNAMGLFMSEAVNLSDALARSLRIDLGMKAGLQKALGKLLGTHGEDLVIRCFTGIMYAGGDDLMAVWPSSVSLPLLLAVSETFWEFCGRCRQLSVAVVGGKVKHNVWNTIDAVAALLGRCKSEYRAAKKSGVRDRELVAVVSFYHSEAQPLKEMVEHAIRRYRALGIAMQPYFSYRDPKGLGSRCLASLAAPLLSGAGRPLPEELLAAERDVEGRVRPLLRALRRVQAVLREHGAAEAGEMAKVFATYVARQVARLGEGDEIARLRAYAVSVVREDVVPPLYDLYLLLKLLEGGRT